MKTPDGQELRADLLAAFAEFRWQCSMDAMNQEWRKQNVTDERDSTDARFEEHLGYLIGYIRGWWEIYKQDWRTEYPLPPNDN